MVRKASLGVEPYAGKQYEDQNGPIDTIRKTDPWVQQQTIPDPAGWVQLVVGRSMRFQDSMSHHPHVESTESVRRAAVLKRWLLNGNQALFSKADADIVLAALQRSPFDPVDPAETPTVKRDRDNALGLARSSVMTRRSQLI